MIDWIEALQKVGIDAPLGTDEFSVICPFHDDKVASCAINVEKGVWFCFAVVGSQNQMAPPSGFVVLWFCFLLWCHPAKPHGSGFVY